MQNLSYLDSRPLKIDHSKNLLEFDRFYESKFDPIKSQFGTFHGTTYSGRNYSRKNSCHCQLHKCCCFLRQKGEMGSFQANSKMMNSYFIKRMPEYEIDYSNHLHTCEHNHRKQEYQNQNCNCNKRDYNCHKTYPCKYKHDCQTQKCYGSKDFNCENHCEKHCKTNCRKM